MDIRLLTHLSNILKRVASQPVLLQHFNLNDWVDAPEEVQTKIFNGVPIEQADPECGTTACAIGFAMQDPLFKAEGLGSQLNYSLDHEKRILVPVYDGLTSWNAVDAFFDLAPEEAYDLFASYSYEPEDWNNPLAVAERIDKLLASGQVQFQQQEQS